MNGLSHMRKFTVNERRPCLRNISLIDWVDRSHKAHNTPGLIALTHRGQVKHICVNKLGHPQSK